MPEFLFQDPLANFLTVVVSVVMIAGAIWNWGWGFLASAKCLAPTGGNAGSS
jgi:hypothetical protein